MSKTIAGLYELHRKIGSGGGGIAFLGRHTRLNKTVVLKADKRKLSVGEEKLRREVDFLKELSHSYIPQVYDFVQEDGITYTVMDYIDGDSLDKLIARGDKPSEANVIKWVCQLLDALNYLHTRPPYGILHGDIKPANIMVRSNGDICLIDYNIALALGENGATRVGFSRGYASPEHYGSDSAVPGVMSDVSATGSSGAVLLDVRSDIYSLGATIYHLISGTKPASNASDVAPLFVTGYSSTLFSIIEKAMAPAPENRYQTAAEMLNAVKSIPDYDPDLLHFRKVRRIGAVVATLMLVSGVCLLTAGLKINGERKGAIALSEQSANELAAGNVSEAVKLSLEAADTRSIFKPKRIVEAQLSLTNALGVYDLSDKFSYYDTIELPSAPFNITISDDGKYILATYAYEAAVFETETLNKVAATPIKHSSFADAVFVGNDRFVCAGEKGVVCVDIATNKTLWESVDGLSLAACKDGSVVATTDRVSGVVNILDTRTGKVTNEIGLNYRKMTIPENDIFANPWDYIFSMSADGSNLAVSFDDGSLSSFNVVTGTEDFVISAGSVYARYYGGFCGELLASVCEGGGNAEFMLTDVDSNEVLAEYKTEDSLKIKISSEGVVLARGGLLSLIDPNSMTEKEVAYIQNENIDKFCYRDGTCAISTSGGGLYVLDSAMNILFSATPENRISFVAVGNNIVLAGSRDSGTINIIKSTDHHHADAFYYDPSYVHDEARLNRDGSRLMLFDYRGFKIWDDTGKAISEVQLPESEKIYDQQYRKEDVDYYLEVIWYDGTIRKYSADTGELISEEQGEIPDRTLYEEFFASKYRFESSLHGAPKVYLRKNDKLVGELEADSYLTYVSEVDGYIIAEYVNTDGERYGVLMDENLNMLAMLPGLCDACEGELIFDYNSGFLRKSKIYSLDELIEIGSGSEKFRIR